MNSSRSRTSYSVCGLPYTLLSSKKIELHPRISEPTFAFVNPCVSATAHGPRRARREPLTGKITGLRTTFSSGVTHCGISCLRGIEWIPVTRDHHPRHMKQPGARHALLTAHAHERRAHHPNPACPVPAWHRADHAYPNDATRTHETPLIQPKRTLGPNTLSSTSGRVSSFIFPYTLI